MAKISKADVLYLAKLARIKLAEAEVKKFTKEVEAILGYVRKVQSVDTSGVKSTSQVTGLVDVWREDKINQDLDRTALLKNVPKQQDGYIKVKKVL